MSSCVRHVSADLLFAGSAPYLRALLGWPVLLSMLLAATACRRQPTVSAPLAKPPSESALGRVTLSVAAEHRLDIAQGLTPLAIKRQPARRLFRGEVLPAPGAAAWVIAPQAGTVQPLPGSSLPQAGTRVQAGQVVATLSESLAPTERAQVTTVHVDADAQVARARVQDEASDLALRRAERLLAQEAVSSRVVEEAKAQRALAQAALQAALAQQTAIAAGPRIPSRASLPRGALSQTPLVSPLTGTVFELRVATTQQVLAGAPLLHVLADDPLWVRVSVPAGELTSVLAGAAAQVDSLSSGRASAPLHAEPAPAPPRTAQPQQGTVDRYFVLPQNTGWMPGQIVGVWLQRNQDEDTPVVPAAAVLYDPSGASWVYERAAPQVFLRRRVEVVQIEDGVALLGKSSVQPDGLRVGSAVVTAGAIELYGAEFGSGK